MSNINIAEVKAAEYFMSQGYEVFTPTFGVGSCDMVVIGHGVIKRVEVKGTHSQKGEIELRKKTHTVIKKTSHFDSTKSDITFLINLNTNNFIILQSEDLEGRRSIKV